MSRARTATEGKDYDLAIKLLTAIIDIKPDYIEAWNRRATLYFHKRDYVSAMADLRAVLQREPRHFGAWAGLGMILQDVGDEQRALDAFRRAVELYPRMERIPDLVKRLTETVDGRESDQPRSRLPCYKSRGRLRRRQTQSAACWWRRACRAARRRPRSRAGRRGRSRP